VKQNSRHETWIAPFLDDLFLRFFSLLVGILFFLPSNGIPGLSLCWFWSCTNLPCPGCGLTRSVSNLLHGQIHESINYSPFGLFLAPVLISLGCVGMAPRQWRDRFRDFAIRRSAVLTWLAVATLVGLVVFGVIRALGVKYGWMSFPHSNGNEWPS
jgi:Protein of unknown function (DUF2752)